MAYRVTVIPLMCMCMASILQVSIHTPQKQPERIGDLLAYNSIIIKASEEYEDTPW